MLRVEKLAGRAPPVTSAFFQGPGACEELKRKQNDERGDTEPCEPIAGSRVKRFLARDVYFSSDRYEAIGHRLCFGQDATAVIAQSQEPVARRTSQRETVFDRAHYGHARVEPPIEIEVPRRYQQQVRARACVLSAELGKVHVLANLESPLSRRFLQNDSLIARFLGFDTRDEMMLVVVRF